MTADGMTLRITILGCGPSTGVPRVGNDWGACNPNNPKNRRQRSSILVEKIGPGGSTAVLIDTSPDLREQLLGARIRRLDGVIFTHDHADHTHGIDDLRVLCYLKRKLVDVWADPKTLDQLRRRFDYCFGTQPGSNYPPILKAHTIENLAPVTISGPGGGLTFQPFRQLHGDIDSLGLRVENVAYSCDLSGLPDEVLAFRGGPRSVDLELAALHEASKPSVLGNGAELYRAREAAPGRAHPSSRRDGLRGACGQAAGRRRAGVRRHGAGVLNLHHCDGQGRPPKYVAASAPAGARYCHDRSHAHHPVLLPMAEGTMRQPCSSGAGAQRLQWRPLSHPHPLIPTAKIYDTFAQCRCVRVAMRSGAAMSAFQALQQASTISS